MKRGEHELVVIIGRSGFRCAIPVVAGGPSLSQDSKIPTWRIIVFGAVYSITVPLNKLSYSVSGVSEVVEQSAERCIHSSAPSYLFDGEHKVLFTARAERAWNLELLVSIH